MNDFVIFKNLEWTELGDGKEKSCF